MKRNKRHNKKHKFEKINPPTTWKNFLSRLVIKTWSNLRYGHSYFFDTNIVINDSTTRDGRIKRWMNPLTEYLITDSVAGEIQQKLNNGFSRILNKDLRTISFEQLRYRNPYICPIYYNFISCFHNPAVLDTPDFAIEDYWKKKLKGRVSEGDEQAYTRALKWLSTSKNRRTNIFGEQKGKFETLIDDSIVSFLRKKREAVKSYYGNYFNDYKNLSLIILYCLVNRRNTTFVTADSDAIAQLFIWIDCMCQQLAFKKILSDKHMGLTNVEKGMLYRGKWFTYFVEWDQFQKEVAGLRADILNHDWKKDSFYIRLLYWDQTTKNYYDGYRITFNGLMRELLLNLHNGKYCPFGRNNINGRTLGCLYWPLQPHNKYFRIVMKTSRRLITKDTIVPPEIHQQHCYFSWLDKQNKIENFSQFY